jgi:hypothetical protein
MSAPNFRAMETNDLLQIIPATENSEWEFKSAGVFAPQRFNEFKRQRLGRIVSSFANSGGGYLLLGKEDGTAVFENVPTHEGRATMEDHLSLVMSQCVTPHYKDFEVFRLPITGRGGESVLVVAFADSQAAPHQSNADTNYYYRLPGSCQPAPHFHLELLRGRYTRAALKIHGIEHNLENATYDQNLRRMYVNFYFVVHLENISMQSATAWGIRIQSDRQAWNSRDAQRALTSGAWVHGRSATLLPNEQVELTLQIDARVRSLREWEHFNASFVPVSQNFIGEPLEIRFPTDIDKLNAMRKLKDQITALGFSVEELTEVGLF